MSRIGLRLAAPEYIETALETITSWTVTGSVYDADTYEQIPGATINLVVNATNEKITKDFKLATANYEAWTDQNPTTIAVLFRHKGYQDQKVQINVLDQNPDVYLVPGKSSLESGIAWWQIAMIAAAVAIYAKRSKKVSGFDTGDILPIFLLVGGIIGFSVIEQVLQLLGLWKSRDSKDLDNAADDPNSFWNPNYWQTIKPANATWTYVFNQTQGNEIAENIYDSFGAFNDCEECVISEFKKCKTKANASFICWCFSNKYGQDMLTFLRGGVWPQDRLSDSDVNKINQYISNLPKY